MPLQNRVTPFGEIVAVPERGLFIGNRGVLHDEHKRLTNRRWALKAWIICQLEFEGRHREVMTPRRWTELFFLDEAAAIAAGHRPCFECRRAQAKAWQAAWQRAQGLLEPPRAPEMDTMMHSERVVPRQRRQRTWTAKVESLPDGAFVAIGTLPYLVQGETLRPWSWRGYGDPVSRPSGSVTVLTPPSSIAVLKAGYRPVLHPSANVTEA